MNESVLLGSIAIPNMYAPKSRVSKCVRQKLIEQKGDRDKCTIIIEEFNIFLSVIEDKAGRGSIRT